MQISEHYPAFSKQTLLVLTNNELAKLYAGEGREINEYETINTPESSQESRKDGIAMVDSDAVKHQRLVELYNRLNTRLLELLSKGFDDIILCAPEANKNELVAALHPDVERRVKSVVPKNLASMELSHVIRILFET